MTEAFIYTACVSRLECVRNYDKVKRTQRFWILRSVWYVGSVTRIRKALGYAPCIESCRSLVFQSETGNCTSFGEIRSTQPTGAAIPHDVFVRSSQPTRTTNRWVKTKILAALTIVYLFTMMTAAHCTSGASTLIPLSVGVVETGWARLGRLP